VSARAATWLACSLWGLSLASVIGGVVLLALNRAERGASHEIYLFEPVVAVVVPAFGALIVSRRPEHPIGWILLGPIFIGIGWCAAEYAIYTTESSQGALPAAAWAGWLPRWTWAPGIILLNIFLPLLYPTGAPPSRRWRPVVWLALALMLLTVVGNATDTMPSSEYPELENPVGIAALDRLQEFVNAAFVVLYLPLVLSSVVGLFLRFRHARGDVRQQLKWFAYFSAVLLVYITVTSLARGAIPVLLHGALNILIVAAGSAAIGVAILKYRLYDIDILIRRTVVYGALTSSLLLVYLALVFTLSSLARVATGQSSSLVVAISTLAVAALFRPLRARIQQAVDRRFYRRRYDAVHTLDRFSQRLRDEIDLASLSQELHAVVAETMQPAHVSLWLARSGSR
jgi:hypothetical protein